MNFLKRITSRKSSLPANGDLPTYRTENALEVLREYDIVFLVDDSGSMAGSRWNEASTALAGVAGIASQYDPDGIDIYFLNSQAGGPHMQTPGEVTKLFQDVQPWGPTPTGRRLDMLLTDYINKIDYARSTGGVYPKPVNFIVITDGVPTDDPREVIIRAARRLDANNVLLSQVGIQFIQVGDDSGASRALKEMDDKLGPRHGIRDMVDTTPYKRKRLTEERIVKILLGGINRRVDNMGGAAVLHP
ncbi:VWA domain-containing protein [Rhizoctonia solani]|uniref:VWA domain-containing protein n=1 Tax=Rhizoctonia solani TaxID=456999 RepID=A0A8H7HBL3_9AGAM